MENFGSLENVQKLIGRLITNYNDHKNRINLLFIFSSLFCFFKNKMLFKMPVCNGSIYNFGSLENVQKLIGRLITNYNDHKNRINLLFIFSSLFCFLPEIIVASFMHLMLLICKLFINHFSKCQFVMVLFT